jgi:PPOX class probable F420-dependent enzyme
MTSADLDDAPYVNLLSFKRDGGEVRTPVWTAFVDGKIGIYTAGDSYKVKRIRRNPQVRVARCDVRGNVLGPWHEGTCAIVEDPAQKARILAALLQKYGWQARILNFFAAVSGRAKKRAFLEVTLR